MHPVAYLDLVAFVACLVALGLLVRGHRKAGLEASVAILLAVLLVVMTYYTGALFLEWSDIRHGLEWAEDYDGVFIPFIWAFVFYAFAEHAVEGRLKASLAERLRAEKDLVVYQQRLRSLASELSLAEERERHRIATGLHDDACQNLVISKMKLEELSTPTGADAIAGICNTLEKTIESVRDLIFDLSTPTLYKFGLEAALRELLDEKLKAQHGLHCTFNDDGAAKPLSEDVRVLLFQSVRELLINIIKHAHARNVTVNVARQDDSICITVADDGAGFNADDVSMGTSGHRGFGLFNIQERLKFIGGSLTVDSRPGKGSRFALLAHLDHPSRATNS